MNKALTRSAAGLYVLVAVILYAPVFRLAEVDSQQQPRVIPQQDGRHALRPVKSFVLAFPSRQEEAGIANGLAEQLPPDPSLMTPAGRLVVATADRDKLVVCQLQRTRVRDPPVTAL